MTIRIDRIPRPLSQLKQWVLWKIIERDGEPTKVPFQLNGQPAKSNTPATWGDLSAIAAKYDRGGYDGIGFMFCETDDFCGIDLDGCRDPQSGQVAEWAREIIRSLDTYGEVSPSQTGVKLFAVGKVPFASGRKREVPEAPKVCGKTPAIEMYDKLRYFAVTGWRLACPHDPQARQEAIDALAKKHFPDAPAPVAGPAPDFRSEAAVIDRARKYLAKLPPAISGSSGHNATFHAACVLVCGFDLNEGDSLALLREYNQACQPPWSERELQHKISQALKQGGQRGYLRYASPQKWDAVRVPDYKSPPPKPEPRVTLLADAAKQYLASMKDGKANLIEMGIPLVDYALGGGVERGELIIIAARPSHGKSAVALQCVHEWTSKGKPCLIVSEEMGALALGKRTVQYMSDVPQEHWPHRMPEVEADIDFYAEKFAPAIIAESCVTCDAAVEWIERAVTDHKIEAAIVDYAQLLRSDGKSRYEQVTNTSIALKQAAAKYKIPLLMLCQLSREIESRNSFVPIMADLKESGQLEQDADVILFLVWPYRIDNKQPSDQYRIHVAKNRNRQIMENVLEVRFIPSRQKIVEHKPKPITDRKNYDPDLARFNDGGFPK